MGRGTFLGTCAAVVAAAAVIEPIGARAEPMPPPVTAGAFAWGGAPKRLTESPREMIEEGTNALGGWLGGHLGKLTYNTLRLDVDAAKRRAWIGLGRRARRGAAWVGGQIDFAHGRARIKTNLELRLGPRQILIDLPAVEVVPRSEQGARYVELRLPLFERAF